MTTFPMFLVNIERGLADFYALQNVAQAISKLINTKMILLQCYFVSAIFMMTLPFVQLSPARPVICPLLNQWYHLTPVRSISSSQQQTLLSVFLSLMSLILVFVLHLHPMKGTIHIGEARLCKKLSNVALITSTVTQKRLWMPIYTSYCT